MRKIKILVGINFLIYLIILLIIAIHFLSNTYLLLKPVHLFLAKSIPFLLIIVPILNIIYISKIISSKLLAIFFGIFSGVLFYMFVFIVFGTYDNYVMH